MKKNRIPTAERLRQRIAALEVRREEGRWHPPGSNPYWACRECGIRDPEVSIRGGRHYKGCRTQGIAREIEHYRGLLRAITDGSQAG